MSQSFAVQTDTALAALYNELWATEQRIARKRNHIIQASGAKYYYRGRKRVTDRTFSEAVDIVRDYLANSRFALISYGADRVEETLDVEIPAAVAKRADLSAQIDALEARYTGWSRFFLVTSSPGHIHSSMHCSSCRSTTTYGWLPELSGSTEAEAVKAHGPALCSVCFPSAPVDWVGGRISVAKAEKAAA